MKNSASNLAVYHGCIQIRGRVLLMIQVEVGRHQCSMLAEFQPLI